ncbi:MAG: fibronectin type III domain-containing protein [Bacteroidales bacterium]|nr:fibronectin type III domain-containing protein [Bacteroidales bacterium]
MKKLYLLLTFFALSCMSSIGQVIYSEGFEDFDVWPTSWSRDQWDNDNFNWVGMTDQYGAMFGTNYAVSFSFINGQTLTPDNWFTSPAIQINTPSSLSFWVRSSNYPGEHYAVYIANSDVYPHLENFEVLVPERVAAAQWENVSVSIPAAYWGSSVRIAFRHFNSVGIGELGLDNVAVTMALGAINTMGVSDVTPVSATVTGYINPGMMAGYTPDQEIQYGFYWSTSPNPGFDPFDSNLDMVYFSDHLYAPMSFDIPITMLQPNTTYYVRSFYEVYNDTLEMGNELSFHTPVCESAEDRYETACGEYQGITESGTYTLTYTNQYGCDSVVTLHLTIVDDFVIGTYPVQNVTSNSASLGGYLDFSCDNVYPQLGVCYSTSPNPTVDDTYMLAPMSPGSTVPASSFTLTAEGLAANTTYYVRAFGITSEDTVYGQEETFTTYGYAAFNGTVVSIATGLPIAGAEILISAAELQNEGGMQYWYRGESIKETVTDSNGVFFVDSIVMSDSFVRVFVDLWAEGYQSRAYLSNLNTGINSNSYILELEPCYEVPYMVHWEELNNGSYQLSWWAMGYAPGDSIDPKYSYQLTYDVYENGSLIAEGLTNQWYMLPSFNANSCYQVRGICPNGVLSDTSECATIKPVPPVVVTNNTTEITGFTAVLSGEITFDGNSEIYSRGFYTNTIPTLDSGNVHYYYVDSESYTFSTMVSNLEPETTYYVWAYAMNEAGETYSNMTSFTTTRACYAPADFQASDVMASSAFLTWSDGNEPSSAYYELSYKAFGADSWTVVNLTNPFCMLSGLQQNTSYMARVRTFCEEGLASPYYSLSFKTSCVSGGPLVTIGDNSTYGTDVFPTNICYNYSYNQQIYLASEIGGAREISEIDLQCFNQTTRVRDMEVYMGHTDKQYFSNNADWIPYTELQLVYSGEITFNDTHEGYWLPIVLDSSFAYNGSDNLVIVFRDNSGWWQCDGQRFYTHPSSGSRTLYAYRDGSAYSMQSPGSGTMSSYRDNLRIPGVCLTGGCDQSNVVVVSKTDHSAQLAIAAGNGVEAVELEYKAVNDNEFTPIAVQGDSCNLTGLMGSTDYVLRIRSLCTEDTTDWKMVYFSTPVARYDRLYVTTTGTGNGSSWEQATNNLSAALSLAAIIREDYDFSPEIWVAEGTYYGGVNTSEASFVLNRGTKLYGGFAGTESSIEERDIQAHTTILDGQNNQRVLYQNENYYSVSDMDVVDGFTIRNGNSADAGGGAYLRGNFEVRNCRFLDNRASSSGGAVYVQASGKSNNFNFRNCEFTGNNTPYQGGAVCDFNDYCSYFNCKISGNHADNQGGGIYGGSRMVQCEISNNTAGSCPGLYEFADTLVNCNIVGNVSSGSSYAGLNSFNGVMINTVVWGNIANGNPLDISNYSGIIAFNSAVRGLDYEGVINLSADNFGGDTNKHYPFFVSPENADYRLRAGSALIEAGMAYNNLPAYDMAGESRVFGDALEIGCYEFHNEQYCIAPIHLAVSDVMSNSALLTWQDAGNLDELSYYELSYKLEGDGEWTVMPEQLQGSYKMLTGLLPDTTYLLRMRSFCSNDQSSAYTPVLTFKTLVSSGSCPFGENGYVMVKDDNNNSDFGGVLPSNFFYNYSYSQQIYRASEIDGAGVITSLALQYFYSTSQNRNMDIYLGHTDKSSFSSNTVDWVPSSDLTLVYSGTVSFNNSGDDNWLTIDLQQSFEYNGEDNLVLVVDDNHGSYYNNTERFYTHQSGTENVAMYAYKDGTNFDPNNPPTSVNGRTSVRNNLKLNGQCIGSSDCERSNLVVMDVTSNSAKLIYALGVGATGIELQYGIEGSDYYETMSVQANEYQLTGLRYNTAYEARIRSLCSGDEQSSWKTVHFTTQTVDLDRLYVTTTGTGDGSSWENATNDLAWALNTAAIIRETFGTDVEVWMAEGTYYGDSTSKSAFTMVDGVNVFGGFAGTETELSQRDFNAHPTILDGQNNQRVLCQDANFDTQTIWDGFTLQHGYVTSNNNNGDGGAAYLRTNTVLRNCNIVNNTAYSDGGGVYIVAENYRPVLLDHCNISHNTAIEDNGGGVYTSFGILRYCNVSYNRSSNENGGGVYVYNASNNNGFGYALSNCLIANNSAAYYGGGVYNRSANTVIANSTIVNNNNTYSNYQGAGVYCYSSTSMINSILWGNEMSSGISNLDGSYSCQYCATEEVVTGTGNISLMASNDESAYFSPHFVNPSLVAGYTDNTDNVDWHLSDASIGVNRGNNSLVATADSLDLDGNVRIQVQTVDMGCYESPYNGITLPEYGAVVYVKQGGSGTMDGTSWANASASIPEALSIAAMNDADIWVAEGVYYGDSVSNNAFIIVEGVDVYGGFAGDEAEDYNLSLRDFDAHTSILDGQNSQRVLFQLNDFSNQQATWDGFTIQNGRAEYENNNGRGGGANLKGGVTLNHCIVTNNYSYNGGGGVYCMTDDNTTTYLLNSSITHNTARYDYGGGAYLNSKVVADNCEFAYNTAQSGGGGVYNYSSTIRNCTISHNTASSGAGVYNHYGTISSSVISYNTASGYGGGLYLNSSNSNTVTVSNCLVANNTSNSSGAGVYSGSSHVIRSSSIVNNKITGSSSSYQGAGVCSDYNTLTIANSIVWGNEKNGETSGITGTHVANYVASDDACTGEHNVALMSSADAMFSPKFVNPSVEAGAEDTTSDVDWHLAQGSPCVNHGDNSLAATCDLAGAARIQQDTIDMGCYESPYNSVALPVYDEIVYVVEGGAGTKTGENWANAMGSLQDAVQIASIYNATVWVAVGTYRGDGTSENAFVMKPGVNVYGGFAGNETPDYDLSQRDFTANATILDGQFSQRVLMQPAHFTANTAVVWDGFDIRNGRVNGDGAGAYLRAYSTLRNCKVQYNTIASSTYSYDYRYGAGVYAYGYNSGQRANISHCKISYNGFENVYYGDAGGIYTQYANVDHAEISHNTSTYHAGGAYVASYSKYSNCLVFANTAPNYAGGVYLTSSSYIYLYNCDIVNNTSTSSNTNCGGGIYANNNSPVLTNCIVWGNKRGYVVNNFNRTTMSNVTYCAVEEGYNGTGNIALASSNDGVDNTMYYVRFNDPQNEDYQLHPTSNCVNIGNASIELDALDFYGNPRVIGNMVDMGCSEVQDESNCNSVINLTASNITTVSAQLNWQPTGEETQWVVVYGMVNSNETTSMTIDDNPSCLLEGLQNNRQYLAKVRAVCDESSMSIFSIPVSFQTSCDSSALDTLPNFSSMNPVNDEIIYNNHVNFSWATMANATSYDFYLWKSTENEPGTPTRSGLTQPIVNDFTVPNYGPGLTYYWKVVAWNECISKTSPVMTVQTNKVPDLHVTNVVCSNASLGQSVTVEWTVKNDGEGNTTPGVEWTDYIWLVHDADVRYYDSHDRNLLQIGSLQALNAGESYTNQANVTIPTDIEPGNYFLFVFADQPDAYSPDFSHCPGGVAPVPYTPSVTGDPYPYVKGHVHFGGVIDEEENNDNFFYILLTILPPPSPDLVVSAITHSVNAQSGGTANVSWTVTNQGEAAAMGSWTDAVYLSSDTILDTESDLRIGRYVHEGPMVINGSYQMSEEFTVPVNYSGDYYFIIVTDNNNTVYEGLQEMNNMTISDAMPVTMTWLTDLQVDSVAMSEVVDANGLYNCSFKVANKGASPTNVSGWTDGIYISQNPVLDVNNATQLASIYHSGVLPAQNLIDPETSSYWTSVRVRIPANITGNWYLHVKTDIANNVFEYQADDNNVYTYQPALNVLSPDLTVTGIELPDVIDPNIPVRIQWTVRNEGPGNVVGRSFTDKFFFNGSLLYTANVHDVNISAGESIVRYATIQIPCVVNNTAELTVTTDVDAQMLEADENNNSLTVNMFINTPDLVVNGVAPIISANNTNSALWSGTAAELSYTVTNSGELAIAGANMTDKVYFSTSATSYQASDLIYTNVHSVNLGEGESATYQCTVTIPNGVSGNYYYHVVINANDGICEGTNTGANENASDAVEVMLSPSPDLVIAEVTAPSQVYIGAGFQLTYTTQNQGTAAINQSVVQKFYYSTSPTVYDTLKLLATTNDYLNLAVNGSVTNVLNVTMPANVNVGNYYIHMVTDANNQVYEHNGEANNHNHSNNVLASTYQLDLQLTQLEGPDVLQWGQTATYTLHVRNNTSLPTLASSWDDVIYLSTDDVLQNSDRLMQSVRHTTVLEGGAEYEVEIQVTIPYGTSSTAYLIAITDFNSNNPDINVNNNILTKTLTINSVPTPDLAVNEVVVLDDVYAGQPARLAYKVTNVGEVNIAQQTWTDKLFVSYNNTYENIDIQLLGKERSNMTLAPNEFYTDTLTFTVPLPYNGDLYLLMMANASNNPYEVVQNNNTASVAVNVILPLPGDLVVTEVSCDRAVVSGQQLHATWTIQNIGDNALGGNGLRSLVYISTDTTFDANDRLLGSVTTNNVSLPIDATMQQSLAGRISGLAEGSYFLIVKTDVTNAFNEVSDNNNTACSTHPFLVTIRPLPFNTNVYDTVINDVVSDYMINVGDQVNQTVRVHINSEDSAMGAVNMIYATYNNMGSNLNYSYSTIGQYSANSELYIPATQPGYYGVNIYGSTPTNQPQNMIVRADVLPFELMGVHDNHGGNTGVTTVELTGSRFRPDMTVCLRNGNEVICADTLIYVNYYRAYAQFDLTGRTPGVYDVSAVNFCEGEAVLSNAFTIENGQPSGLSYNLLFPSSPRPNRNVVMMLEFGNIGNVDLHEQVLEIISVGGSPIALTPDGLSQHRTVLQVPLSIDGEPAGLLRPGSYGTLNIYCYSSGALIFTIKPVEE